MKRMGWWALSLVPLVFGLSAVLAAPAKKAAATTLDGKTFEVTLVGEEGDEEIDTLTFQTGMFDSVGHHRYGFGNASYTATPGRDGVSFSAETRSDEEGRIVWKGKVTGDTIEGTMKWTDLDGNVMKYTFRGRARS